LQSLSQRRMNKVSQVMRSEARVARRHEAIDQQRAVFGEWRVGALLVRKVHVHYTLVVLQHVALVQLAREHKLAARLEYQMSVAYLKLLARLGSKQDVLHPHVMVVVTVRDKLGEDVGTRLDVISLDVVAVEQGLHRDLAS